METIVGLRWKDMSEGLWSVIFQARIVNNQDRIAESLQEVETPGFTTYDIRSQLKLTERLLLYLGVENLTDKFYQEHLDYRTGLGVFRRGRSFYIGSDFSY